MLWRGGGFRAKIAGMNFGSLGVSKMNCSLGIEWHLLPKIWYFLLGKMVSSQPSTWINSILRDDGEGIPAVILVHGTCGLLRWTLMDEGVVFCLITHMFTPFLMSLTLGQSEWEGIKRTTRVTRVTTTTTATALRSPPPIPPTTVTPSTTKTTTTTARTTATSTTTTTTTTTAKRQRQRHVVLLQILTVYSSPIPGRPKVFARYSQAIDQYLTEGRVGNGVCDPAADLMSICWVWWWIAWFCSVWLPPQLAVLDSRWWVINSN